MVHAKAPESVSVNGRAYRWPQRPLVVVCLDGSSVDYISAANNNGVTPYLGALMSLGNIREADAAMPTFTNPNNMSIVTGVAPAVHGISGNFYLDQKTGQAIMMNDASLLRSDTILAAFSRAGAKVAVITAKDKLRQMLGAGHNGLCISAEQEGQPVYSSTLSEYVLQRGVEIMSSERPDLMYLSTSDYIQHMFPPGAQEANAFYQTLDREFARLDHEGVTLVITADHGMNAKTDESGQPHVIFLQTLLDNWFGTGSTTVILPITDPYTKHHGSLGSFASVYLKKDSDIDEIIPRLSTVSGIQRVLDRAQGCRLFELPPDRIGDILICADRHTVLGTRAAEHDLNKLSHPLRSHGGLGEQNVPIIFNHTVTPQRQARKLRNYDAFWLGLNASETIKM